MYSYIVENYAGGEYRHYAHYWQPIDMFTAILPHAIHHVLPQPLAHGVAVGVDAEHAEGAGADGVDEFALFDAQVLEVHERADGGKHRQELVGVGDEPVRIKPNVQHLSKLYHTHATRHRYHHRRQRNPAPVAVAQPRTDAVDADVGGDEVEDAEPSDVVERDVEFRHRAHHRVGGEAHHEQPLVHPLVEVVHQHVEEGYQQVEYQEAGGKSARHTPNGHQHLLQGLRCEALVARDQERSPYHNVIELHLQQQLEKFPQGDLLLAHEVAGDEHEAVDACLPPHPQQIKVE